MDNDAIDRGIKLLYAMPARSRGELTWLDMVRVLEAMKEKTFRCCACGKEVVAINANGMCLDCVNVSETTHVCFDCAKKPEKCTIPNCECGGDAIITNPDLCYEFIDTSKYYSVLGSEFKKYLEWKNGEDKSCDVKKATPDPYAAPDPLFKIYNRWKDMSKGVFNQGTLNTIKAYQFLTDMWTGYVERYEEGK